MTEQNRVKVAISNGLELVEQGKHEAALKLLDESIAEAVRENNVPWIRTLCHHPAIVSRFTENLASAKCYYEQSLNSDPENARALYGLATVALDQGEPSIAKQYALRCRTAILESDDELVRVLLDLVVKHWPDLAK